MRKIVAFLGRAGSGKDYQCSLLQEKGYKKLAFADALRDIAFSSIGLNTEHNMQYYEQLKADKCIQVITPEVTYGINFREFLEKLGTQGIRKYCPDFWVQALLHTVGTCADNICISDMRFINEFHGVYDYCKQFGHEFECIFCDYRSSRYQEVNTHESAWLANKLVELGYTDLQRITQEDINRL